MAGPSFLKDPDARLDYHIDWSAWLGADVILTSTWEVTPTGAVTLDTPTMTTTRTSIWMSGGTAMAPVTVRNRITTQEGRTEDRSLMLAITPR